MRQRETKEEAERKRLLLSRLDLVLEPSPIFDRPTQRAFLHNQDAVRAVRWELDSPAERRASDFPAFPSLDAGASPQHLMKMPNDLRSQSPPMFHNDDDDDEYEGGESPVFPRVASLFPISTRSSTTTTLASVIEAAAAPAATKPSVPLRDARSTAASEFVDATKLPPIRPSKLGAVNPATKPLGRRTKKEDDEDDAEDDDPDFPMTEGDAGKSLKPKRIFSRLRTVSPRTTRFAAPFSRGSATQGHDKRGDEQPSFADRIGNLARQASDSKRFRLAAEQDASLTTFQPLVPKPEGERPSEHPGEFADSSMPSEVSTMASSIGTSSTPEFESPRKTARILAAGGSVPRKRVPQGKGLLWDLRRGADTEWRERMGAMEKQLAGVLDDDQDQSLQFRKHSFYPSLSDGVSIEESLLAQSLTIRVASLPPPYQDESKLVFVAELEDYGAAPQRLSGPFTVIAQTLEGLEPGPIARLGHFRGIDRPARLINQRLTVFPPFKIVSPNQGATALVCSGLVRVSSVS